MQKYQDVVQTMSGDSVGSTSVLVTTYPGGVAAVIYSDNGITPIANPLTTDPEGNFAFYAANGRYTLSATRSNGITTTTTVLNDILLQDVANGVIVGDSTAGSGAGVILPLPSTTAYYTLSTNGSVVNGFRDSICEWAYNIVPGGNGTTRVDTSEPYLKLQMENNWYDLTNHWMELNFDYLSADGVTQYRPWSWHINRATHLGDWAFAGLTHIFGRTTVGQNFQLFKLDLTNAPADCNVVARFAGGGGSLWQFSPGTSGSLTEFNYGWGSATGAGGWLRTTAAKSALLFDGAEIIACTAALATVAGDVAISTVGKGLKVKEGSNAKQGTATLVAGSSVVLNTSVTANSRIFLTSNADGGTPGWLRVSARTASTSFTITSSSGTDTSTVAYEIFEPA